MVYFALEPAAAVEAIHLSKEVGCAVWVGSDAITEEQLKQLSQDGHNITRFSHPLGNAANKDIAFDLATIEEHHPNEIIWVQYKADNNPA